MPVRVSECLRCGNADFSSDAEYCKRCGAPLLNHCTQSMVCGKLNVPDALFCEYCGAPTTFNEAGLLSSPETTDELPF